MKEFQNFSMNKKLFKKTFLFSGIGNFLFRQQASTVNENERLFRPHMTQIGDFFFISRILPNILMTSLKLLFPSHFSLCWLFFVFVLSNTYSSPLLVNHEGYTDAMKILHTNTLIKSMSRRDGKWKAHEDKRAKKKFNLWMIFFASSLTSFGVVLPLCWIGRRIWMEYSHYHAIHNTCWYRDIYILLCNGTSIHQRINELL